MVLWACDPLSVLGCVSIVGDVVAGASFVDSVGWSESCSGDESISFSVAGMIKAIAAGSSVIVIAFG